jgi:tetratricopeptide (TPR) repeat protein
LIDLHVAKLFEPLISYSLVKWRKSLMSFNIHAVVHAWTRERMSVSEKDSNARKALEMLAKAAPRDANRLQSSTWSFEKRLIIHIYSFFKASGFLDLPTCASEQLLLPYKSAISQMFLSQADLPPSQTRGDLLSQLKLPPCLTELDIIWLRSISTSLKEQGDSATTERLLRKVIEAWDFPYGRPEDYWEHFAAALSDLASVLKDQGSLQEAEKLYQRALDGCIERLGIENKLTLTLMDNLSISLQFQGKYAEAESWRRKALQGWLNLKGANDYDTAIAQNGLGVLLSTIGQLQEAESLFRQGLAVVKAISEDGSPRIFSFETNLAHILFTQGKIAEAEEIFRHIIKRRTVILGEGNPHTLRSMVNLVALLTSSAGKAVEAEMWAQKAIHGFEKSLGVKHIETILAHRSLARALESQGRYSESEKIYKMVANYFDTTAMPSMDAALRTLYELAGVLTNQRKFREAEQHAKAALKGYTDLFGPEHDMVSHTKKMLSSISKNL